MLSTSATARIQDGSMQGGHYIENATVKDNAYAHFGDIHNYPSLLDTRKRKLSLLIESLSFTRMGARERNVADAISDTCEWLFEDERFRAWATNQESQQHHGFFWIRGKPGTGKSTLVKRVMNWAKTQWPDDTVLSYFFNGRSPDKLEQTTIGIYRTLLYQLLSSFPDLHDRFLANFAAKEQEGNVEPWEDVEMQNFLLESICSRYTQSFIIFIDAMDEGHDDEVERMIFFFEQLTSRAASKSVQLRLCLSSRHYPQIDLLHNISIVLENEAGHTGDIETYIRSSLSSIGVGMDDLRQLILQRSQGIFLWVVLVIPLLKSAHRKGKGANAMTKALEGVPKDLNELFTSLLSRDPDSLDECVTLLRWVLYTFESITPDMLCTAITYTHPSLSEAEIASDQDRQERYLLNTSRGLIESVDDFYDTYDSFSFAGSDEGDTWLDEAVLQTVQFIHQTVVEYLLGTYKLDSRSVQDGNLQLTDNPYRADICHANLAETCLKYLTHLSVTTPLTLDTLKNWPLAPYAAKFWWKHVAMSGSACDQSLTDLAATFLINERTRQTWVQLYDFDYPTDLSSAEIFRWGRQVLKQPSLFGHRPGSLCYAIILELPKVVEAVMLIKPAVNLWNEAWGSALQVACSKNLWHLAERLLKLGADANAPLGNRHKGTPLQLASLYGIGTIVQLLINNEADINVSSARLATALQEASRNGHHDVVQRLIVAGADLNQGYAEGDNALIRAFEAGHDDIVEVLLSAGAIVGPEWIYRWPLVLRALQDGRAKIVRCLTCAGLPIRHSLFKNAHGTALEEVDTYYLAALATAALHPFGTAWKSMSAHSVVEALKSLSVATVESLLTIESHPIPTNSSLARKSVIALFFASDQGYEETVKLLLFAGADSNKTLNISNSFETPLKAAARAGHTRIVALLLKAGTKVYITDMYDDQPLSENSSGLWEPSKAVHTIGYCILDQVLETDTATRSSAIQDLFDQAVKYAASSNTDTGPLQVLAGYWLTRHRPATVLRIVDETGDKVIWSSPDSRPHARSVCIRPLWDVTMHGSGCGHAVMERALYDAAKRGNTLVMDLLMAHGVEIAESDPEPDSLRAMGNRTHVKLVRLLITHTVGLSPEKICRLMLVQPDSQRISLVEGLIRSELSILDRANLRPLLSGFHTTDMVTIMREVLAGLGGRNKI